MDAQDLLTIPLRIAGVLYGVGAVALVRMARINLVLDRAIGAIGAFAESEGRDKGAPPDAARNYWHFAGAATLAVAAVPMVLASRWAPWALAAVIVQQLLYFLRQHGRVRAARSPDEAADAAIEPSTRRAFYGSVGLTAYASALGAFGALW